MQTARERKVARWDREARREEKGIRRKGMEKGGKKNVEENYKVNKSVSETWILKKGLGRDEKRQEEFGKGHYLYGRKTRRERRHWDGRKEGRN